MPIVRYGILACEPDYEIGEGLILLLLHRVTHQASSEQCVSLPVVAFENESLNFRQCFVSSLHDSRIRAAGPVSILVELNLLFVSAPEDHRAQPAVPNRQSVLPLVGRMGIPEHRRRP